jgi:chromosome segregation ATPase
MSAQTEKRVQGIKDSSSQQDASASVRQLITLLHQYCSEGSFDALKEVVGEKEELKRDKEKLQVAYDENIQALSRRQAELQEQKASFEKQLSSQRAENEATVKSKQAADENIKKHQAKLTTMEEQIEKQSSSAKQLINEIKKKESLVNALEASKASQQESLTKAEKELAKFRSTQQSMQKRIDELTTSLNETRTGLTTFHSFVVKLDNFEARRSEVYVTSQSAV